MSPREDHSIKNRRARKTLKEKLAILQKLKNCDKSIYQVASESGMNHSTLRKWMKNRGKIEEWCDMQGKGDKGSWRQMQKPKNTNLDEAVFAWYRQSRNHGVNINGSTIREKALFLNKIIGGTDDFRASEGWLCRWKIRYGLQHLSLGGKTPCDTKLTRKFQKTLNAVINKNCLSHDQLFSCFETTLNYKVLPQTHEPSGKESMQNKKNEEKQIYPDAISVMVCSNASGTLKFPPMVIGKYKRGRVFKGTKLDELPVFYASQTYVWINGELFNKWYCKQFIPRVKEFLQQQKLPLRALLLVENAYTHISGQYSKQHDIEVMFLQPDDTNELRAMNQVVLENLKRGYRFRLLTSIIGAQEDGMKTIEIIKNIEIKDASYWIADSWNEISSSTIRASWNELWLTDDTIPKLELSMDPMFSDAALTIYARKIENMSETTERDVSKWIFHDDKNVAYLTDDQIVAIVLLNNPDNKIDVTSPRNTENKIMTQVSTISKSEFHESLAKVITYCEENNAKLEYLAVLHQICKHFKT